MKSSQRSLPHFLDDVVSLIPNDDKHISSADGSQGRRSTFEGFFLAFQNFDNGAHLAFSTYPASALVHNVRPLDYIIGLQDSANLESFNGLLSITILF